MSGDPQAKRHNLDTTSTQQSHHRPSVAMMSFMTASVQEWQQQKTDGGHLAWELDSGSATVVWSQVLVWQGDMCITKLSPWSLSL